MYKLLSFSKLFQCCKVKKNINALARLKCSSHRLEIETGRWHKPKRTNIDERLCKKCTVVENELHFIFECSFLNDLRMHYMDRYFLYKQKSYQIQI